MVPLLEGFIGVFVEIRIAGSGRKWDPARLVRQHDVAAFRCFEQGGVDGGRKRVHQFRPMRIPNPEGSAAFAAEAPLAGGAPGVIQPGTIHADMCFAFDPQALGPGMQVDCLATSTRVYWATHKKWVEHIRFAKAEGTLDQFFKRMLSCRLWVIDDWAAVTMTREVAEEVFDLIDRRKYSSALVLTSNRDVEEWGEAFPNSVLANATIDRLFEQAHTLVLKGKSYRLKGRITTRGVDSTPRGS